ncbi:MAG: tetratricopeptide repeat protein [Chloroflexi bacterium]|nr:MAG: tetratricopeptide repeat protein [Chloroflexota bacterium]
MSVTLSPKRLSLYWDEERVKSLLCEPESLLQEEPWSSWVKQQGGLNAIYKSFQSLPLSEKQRKTFNALLTEPGASLQKYALMLHVSVATYVRYRSSLIKTLVTVLNARLLDKQPARSETGRAATPSNTNLPYQHVPLIGREEELMTLQKLLLQEGTDLLTITGPGGIGKTRLALQVATNLLDDFEDGVFFVSLASITNPGLVPATITQALGLKTGENQTGVELLKRSLRDKQMLLVLDNFEQVIAAAPLLSELLSAARDLKILVTSRAVLHLYGEHEFNVPPLAVPDLNALPPLEILTRLPSVTLFVSRAQAVTGDFQLTNENARVVAEICVRLEGVPLALELAAARSKLFAPRALLTELSHRLTLSVQKSVDVLPRHQTLRNAVAWSYQLLEPDEQALFAELGVFVGGFTVEAADAVCDGTNPEVPMLEQLASLVDKSMLQHGRRENGQPRFIMLETLREYALEQLEALGQTKTVRRQHWTYYLNLVESIEPQPREPDLPTWMKQLEEEHDNIRAALKWTLEQDEVEAALRIAGAVWKLWQIHGHVEEGVEWMKIILSRSQGHISEARAKALWGAGWLGMVKGNLAQSREYFEEGAAISRKLGNERYLGLSLHGTGAVARGQGDFESSRAAFDESLPLFQVLGNTEDIAWTFEHLGATAMEQGDFEQAILYLSQALTLFQELQQNWACAEALTFLGHAALQQRDYVLAQKRYEAALAIYQELEDRPNVATMNSYVGATLFGRGEYERAIGLYKESLLLARDLKDYWGLTWGVERLAEVAEKLGQLERAARLWGAADALRHVSGVSWHPGFHSYYTEGRFASLKAGLGETRWAQLWAEGREMGLKEIGSYALEI